MMGVVLWSGSHAADLQERVELRSGAAHPAEFVTAAAADRDIQPAYGSRLEQIAAQQGAPSPAPQAVAAEVSSAPRRLKEVTVTLASAPTTVRLQNVEPAILRSYQPATGGVPLPAAAPYVLGSTALVIGRTPMDAKWRRVSRQSPGSVAGEVIAKARGLSAYQQLEQVNAWVNRRITFTDDIRAGQPDSWANASESLSRGMGDCEDYAIAKMQILKAAGFDPRDLYLVLVKDLVRRADHAILVARVDGRFVILDNNTDRMVSADAAQDYRPLMSFSGERSWIHGYRHAPEVMLASAAQSAPAEASAADY